MASASVLRTAARARCAWGLGARAGNVRFSSSQSDCRVVVITSGKGGVGKTTTAASFAYGLASAGFKTCVIDFDIGLRNLDIHLGCERRVIFEVDEVLVGQQLWRDAVDRG